MNELRPEIALSWHRSQISGLETVGPNIRFDSDAAARRTRLRSAADPVLTSLAEQLEGSPFAIVLADRDSHIVEVRSGQRTLRHRLDEMGLLVGGVFLEETTGTNSIATAHELQRGIVVHGEEHYLEPFKAFSCYGQPIVHPVARRLAGVLDITCLSRDASPLLRPMVAHAVRDIEANLLSAGRRAQQRLLAEFQIATAGNDRPIVALGSEVVMASRAAAELLGPVDHVRLTALAGDIGRYSSERCLELELSSGHLADVRLRAVDPGTDSVLVELTAKVRPDRAASPRMPADMGRAVYIGGAPGTGRTTQAYSYAGATVVEDIHLLSEPESIRLQRVLEERRSRYVLTGPPVAELTGRAAALAGVCVEQIGLAALADRTVDMPTIVAKMLDELGVGSQVRLAPPALAALAGYSWPGNFSELRTVLTDLMSTRHAGDVIAADLPDRIRVARRGMSDLERAEFGAITAALRECDGNKRKAAQRLGISRTTLYSRMRSLHITG